MVQRLLADRVPVPAVRHIQAVSALWYTLHTQPHAWHWSLVLSMELFQSFSHMQLYGRQPCQLPTAASPCWLRLSSSRCKPLLSILCLLISDTLLPAGL